MIHWATLSTRFARFTPTGLSVDFYSGTAFVSLAWSCFLLLEREFKATMISEVRFWLSATKCRKGGNRCFRLFQRGYQNRG